MALTGTWWLQVVIAGGGIIGTNAAQAQFGAGPVILVGEYSS